MPESTDSNLPDPTLDLRPLPGSVRRPVPHASRQPGADRGGDIDITLVLRRQAPLDADGVLTSEELAAQYGAAPRDVELVTTTLQGLGAQILAADAASRRVRVRGSVDLLERTFGTRLEPVSSPDAWGQEVSHRERTGGLSVPAVLDGVVTAVLGLDDRPQTRTRLRAAVPAEVSTSYTPPELGAIYRFPEGTDGTGQRIAIIELGGGFDTADLDEYFGALGIPIPSVSAVGVDGAANEPGQDPQGADGEVLLDIEVAGALAPGVEFVVYFAPNTDAGFLDAVSTAAHATPPPVAISISWGQNEDQWTAQARAAMDDAFADASALGITVTAASGDNGSSDAASDGKPHADFPASSPHVLGCGGTTLHTDTDGAVTSETVWNNGAGNGATGGGVSDTFALPAWQADAGVPARSGRGGRGVPDVAAVADPRTGYQVRVDGTDVVFGGTSAVAPLWAALVARLAQATGRRFGLLQPLVYAGVAPGEVPGGFRDITSGNNGAYSAAPGWDACTGLGVPDGTALLAALKESG